jgi:hypothetical protein
MAKTGDSLTFSAPVSIGIDPRLAAFYGLGPFCPAIFSAEVASCANANGHVDAIFAGTGTPVADHPGVYTFDTHIDAIFTPEPLSVCLLLTTLACCGWIARKQRG